MSSARRSIAATEQGWASGDPVGPPWLALAAIAIVSMIAAVQGLSGSHGVWRERLIMTTAAACLARQGGRGAGPPVTPSSQGFPASGDVGRHSPLVSSLQQQQGPQRPIRVKMVRLLPCAAIGFWPAGETIAAVDWAAFVPQIVILATLDTNARTFRGKRSHHPLSPLGHRPPQPGKRLRRVLVH